LAADGYAVRINLPATFQFSPATSKSIDIPDMGIFNPGEAKTNLTQQSQWMT
jgi:hypothetical protein